MIREEVTSCKKCGLHATRTNAVPGAGACDADVMFVGEAPGRGEDARGEPFVGAAGTKLAGALHRAGFSRDMVYITNVVKCRPPGNRTPTAPERQACSGHLRAEIEAVRPRIICILGNTAFGSILGGREITRNRGKTVSMDGQLYYITIHPAAIIYNQELAGTFDGDIKRLAEITKRLKDGGEVAPDVEYPSRTAR